MISDDDLKQFFTFLNFPSVSSEPDHKQDVENCFNWLNQEIQKIGFKTERWETQGHPVLFAESKKIPNKPTLLIYNHYDVQPVDPLELWETPPFKATLKDGIVYARGAQDNKGQLFYTFLALKELKEFPINIKWIIEGEEEMGSEGLETLLPKYKEKLKSDYTAIVDCGIPDADTPAVSLGMRGIMTLELELTGTNVDLHAGTHGGIAYNPLRALTEILGNIRDKNGKITIPGFYDSIIPLTDEEKKHISFEFDEKKYEKDFGVKATGGEKDLKPLERNWLRPTLEINGLWGGYQGEGFKTVIPSKAHAKISCRLVKGQDPAQMSALLKDYFEKVVPPGISIKIKTPHGGGPAILSSPHSKIVQAFAKSFSTVFNKPCRYILEGASIPIVSALEKASNSEAVLVGVGLVTDKIHAPNEHFSVDRLYKGKEVIKQAIKNLV